MKHTPAPWAADKLQDRDTFNIFAEGFSTAMCQVTVMENSTRRATGQEVAANARLIAAAPDLLAALLGFTSGSINKQTYEAARAAIAKATE